MWPCAKCAAPCSKPTWRSKWCRTFIDKVKDKAVGAEIVKSIKPGQMVVKIVHDVLVETLGSRRRRPSICAPRRPCRS